MSVSSLPSRAHPRTHAPAGPRLNLGCGPVIADGWINVDGSRRAWLVTRLPRLDRLLTRLRVLRPTAFTPAVVHHDLRRRLPWPDGSVAAIYAGELWEHLEYPDARGLMRECFRILKPDGVLRVCVPDGVAFWARYLAIFDEEWALPEEQRDAKRLRAHVAQYFADICTRPAPLKFAGHFHKWQFDEIQLIDLFRECGFRDVARMAFHISRIDGIAAIERSDFLIVEGVRGG
ncbi:MAG: methyltransferase domain-containing protein [Gammaproteobacteria bacterium]|nr:methyltransferase domain-containing protein [Gammaproteobacteria bacterium]